MPCAARTFAEVRPAHKPLERIDEGKLRSFLREVLDRGCRYGDRHDSIPMEQFCAKVTNEYLTELLAMLATKPLVALTDEQIMRWWNLPTPSATAWGGEQTALIHAHTFGRWLAAEFCRINGLTEPKP